MGARGSFFCIGGPDSELAQGIAWTLSIWNLERLWGFVLVFFKPSMLFPIQEMFGKLRIFCFLLFLKAVLIFARFLLVLIRLLLGTEDYLG